MVFSQLSKFQITDIGLIPIDWEIKKIEDITSRVCVGFVGSCFEDYCDQIEGVPMIRTTNLTDDGLVYSDLKYVTKKFHLKNKKSQLTKGDIVVARHGDSGKACYYDADFESNCLNIVVIRPDQNKADSKFLLYSFRHPLVRKQIEASIGGSVQGVLNTKIIAKISIPSPKIDEQRRIAHILSTLDSKIKLNKEMNRVLEAVGRAIFKRWFIDFEFPNQEGKPYKSSGGQMVDSEQGVIPGHWQISKLNQIADLSMGISPEGSSYNDHCEGLPLLNGAADFQGQVILPRKWTKKPIKVCKKGSLIFCIRATIGNAVFADNEYCLGRGVAALSPKNNTFMEFIYYLLKGSFDELISKASGSVIIGLSKADIEELPIILPDNQTVERFHKICSVLFSKIVNQSQNNITLVSIRDLLIPKLMSGKIRAPVIEEKVEKVSNA